jgi:error-prone DNA polymerase
VVATNDVHYATRRGSMLHDVLAAIRHNTSLTILHREGLLPVNSSRYLASPAEMARRFRELPEAIANSVYIAQRCQVSLDFSNQRLPRFITSNGESEFAYLYRLCHDNLTARYPELRPAVLKQLAHELDVIEQAGLAGYFLIVWDIVNFARTQQIRCQGRGSAANSIVAYLLNITSIDPLQHNLLFERFLSADKFTTPDIDVDFAADRREEVIQYVYKRYGAAHTAMVCNTVTYRARSALRDLGKALDFPLPVVEWLIKSLDTHSPTTAAEQILARLAGDETAESASVGTAEPTEAPDLPSPLPAAGGAAHPLALLAELLHQIDGCPRHLSIHSGGMLITGLPLNEVVPLEPATMPGRVVCQWDKDSVEDAGLIKIDLLALRTLGVISEALGHIQSTDGQAPDIDAIPLDDPALFRMLQRGDTIGVFQVESRAQQQMLPRLKPTCFEDIIVEVAIVRPGPIQGGAVHPYLRRRAGVEPVNFLHPCLQPVLEETKGVLLFQEQAIRVAVAAAGFSAGEADMLRRALSRSRSDEPMAELRVRFLEGAQACGLDPDTADAIFGQLSGFAGFGFCKSHAASFALIAYQTLYLKQYHPAAFYCALFNQQPMGFYSPEVLAGDAGRHGVDFLPPHIDRSDWGYTLERKPGRAKLALRTGLRAVAHLGEQGWQRIAEVRTRSAEPFRNLEDFCRRTRLPRDSIASLIRAGALDHFAARRQLLWRLGEIEYHVSDDLQFPTSVTPVDLPTLPPLEQTLWEYELLGLSPDGQIMSHYRQQLRNTPSTRDVLTTWEIKRQEKKLPNGRRVRVAGMVVVRQRPSTARGITFLSLEDESGLLDLVVKPPVYPRLREVMHYSALVLVQGTIQRADGAVSVLVQDLAPLLR